MPSRPENQTENIINPKRLQEGLYLGSILLWIIPVIVIIFFVSMNANALLLLLNGESLAAKVSFVETLEPSDDYRVQYTWTDDQGKQQRNEVILQYRIWDGPAYKIGENIKIVYDPERPFVHFTHPLSDLGLLVVLIGIISVSITLSILLFCHKYFKIDRLFQHLAQHVEFDQFGRPDPQTRAMQEMFDDDIKPGRSIAKTKEELKAERDADLDALSEMSSNEHQNDIPDIETQAPRPDHPPEK